MENKINIPNVPEDERIGSAFNHLFHVIRQTEACTHEEIIWDLKGDSFFHPFFLAPLLIYKQECEKKIQCINYNPAIKNYLELIHFDKPLFISEDTDLKHVLSPYTKKTYTPVCQFDLCKSNIDSLQSVLQDIIREQSHADYRITTPLSYMLGELVDNMNEHSHGKHGYIFSQYLNKEKCIDLVIADNGITILGSYIFTEKYLDLIQGNDAIALKLANEGRSTKNLPETENRGYGISSSKKMLVEGLQGSFFMLSGNAFHRYDTNGSSFIKLPESIQWNGTIILMRIPVNVPNSFNYSKYVR